MNLSQEARFSKRSEAADSVVSCMWCRIELLKKERMSARGTAVARGELYRLGPRLKATIGCIPTHNWISAAATRGRMSKRMNIIGCYGCLPERRILIFFL